ncbi:unnamed protein product [Euphydryas editha]|uniref:Uncharacterized protein n=1 Tax=Euphydryas editha TaxID=104508 RepID=A0AAU9UHT8_EUPED|nr:unnamed protein product [Euphydryas editha]
MDGSVRAFVLALAAFALVVARAHMTTPSHDNIIRIQLWDAEGLSREPIPDRPPATVKHHKLKVNLDTLYDAMMGDDYHGSERFARHKVRHKRRRSRQSETDLPWRFHSGSGLRNVEVYNFDVPWDVIENKYSGSVYASAVSDSSVPVNVEREVSPPMTLRQDEEVGLRVNFS